MIVNQCHYYCAYVRTAIFGDDDDEDDELFTSYVSTSRFATPSATAKHTGTADGKSDKIKQTVAVVS